MTKIFFINTALLAISLSTISCASAPSAAASTKHNASKADVAKADAEFEKLSAGSVGSIVAAVGASTAIQKELIKVHCSSGYPSSQLEHLATALEGINSFLLTEKIDRIKSSDALSRQMQELKADIAKLAKKDK